MDIQFDCIWKKNFPQERQQAIALWNRFNISEPQEVTARWAEQIAFVAKKNNEVIAITWVNPVKVNLLNNNYFLEYRIFISPGHRIFPLVLKLTLKTKEFFEQNREVLQPACIGMIVVVENQKMKSKLNMAQWPMVEMTFAGYTPAGHHIRVSYFKGARI
jgi:hypothetical protein